MTEAQQQLEDAAYAAVESPPPRHEIDPARVIYTCTIAEATARTVENLADAGEWEVQPWKRALAVEIALAILSKPEHRADSVTAIAEPWCGQYAPVTGFLDKMEVISRAHWWTACAVALIAARAVQQRNALSLDTFAKLRDALSTAAGSGLPTIFGVDAISVKFTDAERRVVYGDDYRAWLEAPLSIEEAMAA